MELINRKFYDAICHFEDDEESQEYYYETLYSKTGKVLPDGSEEILRDQILRVYAALFCDDMNLPMGAIAGFDEVDATADRLYTGAMGFDPRHWYRMQHHFPVIDEDNYERFAALVIADLSAGPLREAAMNGGDMLIVGERDPLTMTSEERKHQKVRTIDMSDVLLGGEKE